MKNSVNAIVNELGLASVLEIELILKELLGEVKKRTLFTNLKKLEEEKAIFKVLPKESSYGVEGYIPGPNMNAGEALDVKRAIVEQGISAKDLGELNWGVFASRILKLLTDELIELKEDLEKTYEDPKSVEMRYFDISIAYHELYGYFFDKYNVDFLAPVENLLKDCRTVIDKKEL